MQEYTFLIKALQGPTNTLLYLLILYLSLLYRVSKLYRVYIEFLCIEFRGFRNFILVPRTKNIFLDMGRYYLERLFWKS